jgi:hypothetical protein
MCSECGVALCYDVPNEEYQEAKEFWDNWTCKECNPSYKGSLKEFKENQMIDKLTGKQKTVMVNALIQKIFEASSPKDMSPAGFRLGEGNENIAIFKVHSNTKNLRGYIHESGLLVLEQNPNKGSWCGKLAADGVECAWIMKSGSYLSFVVRHKGEIHILRTNPRNRQETEDRAHNILAK